MEIFQQSIVQIEPSDFNPEAHEQIWQLDLSSNLKSILETIKNNKDASRVYYIHGEPGSGCSTLLQGLCQQLCNTNFVKESEILFLSLNEGCRKALFWEFMSKLAKKKNDAEKVSLFSKSSVNKDLKKEGLVEFFEDHFKVICIDNGDLCLKFIDSFLGEVLKTCKITSVLVIASQTDHDRLSDDVLSNVTVNGLCDSAAINLFSTELQQLTLTDDELSNLCDLVNCNPVAIQLVCAFLNTQEENDSLSVLEWTDTAGQKSCVLEMVLRLTNKHLKASSTGILCELCFLQQPLPVLNMPPEIEELIKLKLLRVQNKEEIQCIHLPSTLKKYLKCQKDFYSEPDIEFDVLHHWLSLVSNQKLHSLIKEAEEHAWPFVPESWQFIDDKDVGKNESFNVKEHIISKNVHMPSLTELQILHECLYHAYLQKNFKKLAAVTFVLDRFLFWQGDKKISMAIVDYIQEHSPETAIAPQLLVRRARNMKNEGNLRGAEEILDEVSKEKEGVGHWKHRHEFQADLTRAACIQLKGEIQYILGNWLKSAGLLLESIELFANLPNPDKKGLSLGYGLLCPCLRNMTSRDYSILAQKFGLVQLHPLLAAYISSQEAAKSSTYTPMFFVRHVVCQYVTEKYEIQKTYFCRAESCQC